VTAAGARGRRRVVWFVGGTLVGVVAGAVTALATSPAPQPPAAVPRFIEETREAGLAHEYRGGFQYFVGGGVATFDCDDDGFDDVYVAGGVGPAGLYRNVSTPGGALRFARVRDATTDLRQVTGAYPVDIDGDATTDLAVLRVGENVLLRGLGGCRFARANEAWGLDGGDAWTVAFSATWEDDDAFPTLAFGNYLGPEEDDGARRCVDSAFVRPAPSGGYGPPAPLAPGLCALSALFSDWDGTGRHDLRLTNDRHYFAEGEGGEQLWRVEPGRAPTLYAEPDGWVPLRIWGMGIAERDLTGDGLPEVVLTSQGDNKLQTLDAPGRPAYRDIAIERGTTAHRPFIGDDTLPSTAWHPAFADLNNDGLVDLVLTKGNVEAQVDHAAQDPTNLLLQQPDGTFVDQAQDAGVLSLGRSRGAAVVDLNRDGLVDLVEVVRGEPVRVWRNVGGGTAEAPAAMGHWLEVRLRQPGANSAAVGAWLDVRPDGGTPWRQQITVGGGHAGGHLGWTHLGLGDAASAQLRVTWPDGTVGDWIRGDADQRIILSRPS
jgi:hypothetical protein